MPRAIGASGALISWFQVSAPPLAAGPSRLAEKVTLGLLHLFFHSTLGVGRSMLDVHLFRELREVSRVRNDRLCPVALTFAGGLVY